MIQVSNAFKATMLRRRDFKNYATVTLSDGTVLNLTPSNFRISGNSIEDSVTESGKFSIGNTIGKTIKIAIDNTDETFSSYDFTMAQIWLTLHFTLLDNTVEVVNKGYYTVVDPATPGNVIQITAVDDMYKFDRTYDTNLSYPASVSTILTDCCVQCGVTVGFTTFDLSATEIAAKPSDITYRQVVSWIAQMCGYNARIDINGTLQLIWYDVDATDIDIISGGDFTDYEQTNTIEGGDFTNYEQSDTIDGGGYSWGAYHSLVYTKDVVISTADTTITGVIVENDDVVATVGTDYYPIKISGNDFTIGIEQTVANNLSLKLVNLTFRPFSCKHLADPTIEAGDVGFIFDKKGNMYRTLISNVIFNTSGYTDLSCEAESAVQASSEYINSSAEAVIQARKNTTKQLTAYNQQVQRLNELAANSMGCFSAEEVQADNSVIFYLSNKPITINADGTCSFISDSVVYKNTGAGFFVSQDGGESYTAGFDAQTGNLVINILYAIGIVCDWIKGGTLTLGGDSNVDGLLSILNANGVQVVRGDKDGLYAIAGTIGGMTLSNNSIGAVGSGMTGVLIDAGSGKVDWSWSNRLGSWSRFQSGANFGAGQMEHMLFWTGAGGSTGSEGIWVTNASSGTDMGNYIRHGSQQIYRSDGQYVQWGSGSDKRIKKNIKELASDFVKDIFKKLKPVKFQYNAKTSNDRTKTHYGVIAQDMEEIFDEKGIKTNFVSDTDDGWKFVNYHEFHGLELAAIKDLYNTIDRQQAEINELKQQIKTLIQKVGA